MWRIVEAYSVNWRATQNAGIIWLKLAGGKLAKTELDSVEELAAVVDILRNEKPVYYHVTTGDLQSGWEPAGEGENAA
jgi:hypothetical protein